MLTIYRPPRGSDDGSNPESERKVPAGIPYLTKINGKLVMAREKKDKAYSKLDLLGEAFGVSARIARRKSSPESSKSNDSTETLVLPAPEQQPQIAYTSAPIPQQYYPPMLMPGNQQVTHYQPPQQIMQGPQRPPTQQELDQLCRIDEGLQRRLHGSNEIAGPEHSCRKCSERNETFTRTTITMTRHVCANCGRIRSRKYHHEHPIKPGEVPEPAFCRKCQKYASSTSGSDHGGKGKQGKKDRKEKKLQKHGKKPNKSSGDDESSGSSKKKEQKRPKVRRTTSADYIVVEEGLSEEESKGRGRRRSGYREEDINYQRRSSTPFPRHRRRQSHSSDEWSLCEDRPSHQGYRRRERDSRQPPPGYRYVEVLTRHPSGHDRRRRHDSSPVYRGPRRVYEDDVEYAYEPRGRTRRQSGHVVDDESYKAYEEVGYKSRPEGRARNVSRATTVEETRRRKDAEQPTSRMERETRRDSPTHYEENTRAHEDVLDRRSQRLNRPPSPLPYEGVRRVHKDDVLKMIGTTEHPHRPKENSERRVSRASREEARTLSSDPTEDSFRRRRQENASSESNTSNRPWEKPHEVHAEDDTDRVVVTETFVYKKKKKKKPGPGEEARRRAEALAERNVSGPSEVSTNRFSAPEEAAKYYENDWHGLNPISERSEPSLRGGYRRGKMQDSEMATSVEDEDFARADLAHQNIPRAPTPPSPPYQTTSHISTKSRTKTKQPPPYPLSSDSDSRPSLSSHETGHTSRPRKAKPIPSAYSRSANGRSRSRETTRSKSIPRPAYVRQATDGGTEVPLVSSPMASQVSARSRTSWVDGEGMGEDVFVERYEEKGEYAGSVSVSDSNRSRGSRHAGFGDGHHDGTGSVKGDDYWGAGSAGGGARGGEDYWGGGGGGGTSGGDGGTGW